MSRIDAAVLDSVCTALRRDRAALPGQLRDAEELGAWLERLASPPQRALVWDDGSGWHPSVVLDELPGDRRLLCGDLTVVAGAGPHRAACEDVVLEADLRPAERQALSAAQRAAETEALRARRLLRACDDLARSSRSAARQGGADPAAAEAAARRTLHGHSAVRAAAVQLRRTWEAYARVHAAALPDIDLPPPISRRSDIEAMADFLRGRHGPRQTPPRRPRPAVDVVQLH